jgi:hypothetical protein
MEDRDGIRRNAHMACEQESLVNKNWSICSLTIKLKKNGHSSKPGGIIKPRLEDWEEISCAFC